MLPRSGTLIRTLTAPLALSALLALPSPASANGPRTIAPEEAALPTCFGFTKDASHVYAVRAKHTCDAASGKCESATFLARVDGAGAHKTVGYLTYK